MLHPMDLKWLERAVNRLCARTRRVSFLHSAERRKKLLSFTLSMWSQEIKCNSSAKQFLFSEFFVVVVSRTNGWSNVRCERRAKLAEQQEKLINIQSWRYCTISSWLNDSFLTDCFAKCSMVWRSQIIDVFDRMLPEPSRNVSVELPFWMDAKMCTKKPR